MENSSGPQEETRLPISHVAAAARSGGAAHVLCVHFFVCSQEQVKEKKMQSGLEA